MLSTVAGAMWDYAPVMNAITTILLLILIRMWSRNSKEGFGNSKSTTGKLAEKVGKKLYETGKDLVDTTKEITEGFAVDENVDNAVTASKQSTDTLDLQFFGELFVAGFISGVIINTWWTHKDKKSEENQGHI